MKASESVDMDKPRTFYGPHPGFAGASVPIPTLVKRVADELDGQTMPLSEAVARLKAVGIGTVEVVAKYDYIGLLIGSPGGYQHYFCVIKYR